MRVTHCEEMQLHCPFSIRSGTKPALRAESCGVVPVYCRILVDHISAHADIGSSGEVIATDGSAGGRNAAFKWKGDARGKAHGFFEHRLTL